MKNALSQIFKVNDFFILKLPKRNYFKLNCVKPNNKYRISYKLIKLICFSFQKVNLTSAFGKSHRSAKVQLIVILFPKNIFAKYGCGGVICYI